jgi:trans-4-hydroxy-L-proline dehydratase
MIERIKKLRQQSIETKPSISLERAQLLTDFYKSGKAERVSVPVARAMAFQHILANKKIYLGDGELFVGERGPSPMATPTFPEICTHSSQDFEVLQSRKKISFKIDEKTKKIQENEIFPFWSERSMRDIIFKEMDAHWIDAYNTGIFTEFMEQRAPGHTVLDDKIYQKGFLDFKMDILIGLGSLDYFNDPDALAKKEELKAMAIAADALILYASRYVDYLKDLAATETAPLRKTELEEMAKNCRLVPASAPQTFWQALQHYWFVHLGVITELNTWDSFNPGRLDRHLYPFYQKDINEGRLTNEQARELLQSFWIKFNNQPAPPKVGVTAKESSTYTDFCLINLGGLDEEANDATNELTFIILDVIEEMRLLQPSSMVQVSIKNPDSLIKRALRIIQTGFGQPSIFNADAIIEELLRQGKSKADARNGGASGCVESGAFGKEAYILTGYFNLVKILEITLHDGIDPKTGKKIGLETGDPRHFFTWDQFMEAFKKQLGHFVDIKIKGSNIIEQLWAQYLPSPFLSLLVDDCINNGKDYNAGGARYNSSYIQGVGIGSITDCLSAIKYNVYDEKTTTMDELLEATASNFDTNKKLHNQLLYNTPKYGNDDNYADTVLKDIFEIYFAAIDGRPNTRGGHYRINLLPTTSHVYFGSVVGATPDGRKAFVPLSEGISPFQGSDKQGPTAVLKSAAKIDHLRTGGTLLNQKFSPQIMQSEEGLSKVTFLVRSYFRMNGHHIQFNVVTAETLKKAQKNPDQYKDLIVRVAGYSDYFVNLDSELQNEIINRTEQII